jgi:hypothetical protein
MSDFNPETIIRLFLDNIELFDKAQEKLKTHAETIFLLPAEEAAKIKEILEDQFDSVSFFKSENDKDCFENLDGYKITIDE